MSVFFEVTEQNFAQEVLQSSMPVLVEFGAPWCAPCKRLEPVLEGLGKEWSGKVRLGHINVDENPNLAALQQVLSVPTVILFVQGKPRQRMSGFQPRERLVEKFLPELEG